MRFLSLLPALLVLFVSAAAHAQGAGGLVSEQDMDKLGSLFMPPETDETLGWIMSIFGPILGSGDETAPAPLIGVAMGVLNSAALAIGALILTYKLLAGVAQTAHEGNLLGKRWSTLWGPLRVGLGAAALIPLQSGFCLMQKLVVLVAAMGIGLADNVWATSMNAVGTQGTVISAPRVRGFERTGAGLFQIALCKAAVEVWSQDVAQNFNSLPPQVIAPPVTTSPNNVTTVGQRQQVSTYYGQEMAPLASNKICGGFRALAIGTTSNSAGEGVMNKYQSGIDAALNGGDGNNGIAAVHTEGAKIFVEAMMPAARELARAALANTPACGSTTDGSNSGCITVKPGEAGKALIAYSTAVHVASANAIKQANSLASVNPGEAFANVSGSMGWAYAGTWWMVLNRLNGTASEVANQRIDLVQPSWDMVVARLSGDGNVYGDYGSYVNFVKSNGEAYWNRVAVAYAGDAVHEGVETPVVASSFADRIGQERQYSVNSASVLGDRDASTGKGLDEMKNSVDTLGKALGEWMVDSFDPQSDPLHKTNAMAGITTMGHDLFKLSVGLLLAGWVGEATSDALMNSEIPFGGFFLSLAGAFIKPIFALMKSVGVMLMIPALTMAYVLPMMPYILWVGGLVGWLILVVEAVVAAPLWAIAHMRMDGDGIAGPWAQTGYRLLLSLLLRPALMVIGLLLGMVVFAVVGPFISQSFRMAMLTTFGNEGVGLFGGIVMIFLIAAMFYWISYKCFGMIHQVPDRILRWIGGGPEHLGEDEVMNQSRTMAAVAMGQMVSGMRGVPGMKPPGRGGGGKENSQIAGSGKDDKPGMPSLASPKANATNRSVTQNTPKS